MPGNLILNSLQILRFRCFRELRIGRLGRVNLIVGKNNVGKSTVLEALRLFAKPGSPFDLFEIFLARNEILATELSEWGRSYTPPLPFDSLFLGRKALPGEEYEIQIGPIGYPDDVLKIGLRVSNVQPVPAIHAIGPDRDLVHQAISQFHLGLRSLLFRFGSASRLLMAGIKPEELGLVTHVTGSAPPDPESLARPIRDVPLHSISPDGLRLNNIVPLWDRVSLSSLEAEVIDALRIISPEVERVALKGTGDRIRRDLQAQEADDRVPFVKVRGFEEPMPLRALGDGVNRLFSLALALVSARGGLLLVDEIENGIHYSVQADLWRLIFETAARLNVQVFATTHSYDCIQAFEEAARESDEDGVLVRLARKGDRTLVGEFDERELEIAVEGEIEVR